MTIVFIKKNLFRIYHILYHQNCALINLDAYIYGRGPYIMFSENKSILCFAYLFVEKIVDTIYMYIVLECLFHNTIYFAASCSEI